MSIFFFFFIHFHICWFVASACIKIECVMFPLLSACIYCITKNTYRNTNTNKIYQEKGTYLTSHTARSAICD